MNQITGIGNWNSSKFELRGQILCEVRYIQEALAEVRLKDSEVITVIDSVRLPRRMASTISRAKYLLDTLHVIPS